MIDSLLIKNIATYDEAGIELENLKKVNFIYGSNGTGKTTLSNYIKEPDNEAFEGCKLSWSYNQPLQTLVYNKRFREDNFGKADIEGVFTLGHATKEQIELIKAKGILLKDIADKGKQSRESLKQREEVKEGLETQYKEALWKHVYKKHVDQLGSTLTGHKLKETFKEHVIAIDTSLFIKPNYDELVSKVNSLFKKNPEEINPIPTFDFSTLLSLETEDIWQQKIIGKKDVGIAPLIEKLNNSDWVNQGKSFLPDDETCPFCQQQTITPAFRQMLEQYFDELYIAALDKLKSTKSKFELYTSATLSYLESVLVAEQAKKEPNINIDTLPQLMRELESYIVANREVIIGKEKEPSRSVALITIEDVIQRIIEEIKQSNIKIESHNVLVRNLRTEKGKVIKEAQVFLAFEAKDIVDEYSGKLSALKKGIEGINKQLQEKRQVYLKLENEIKELNKHTTSVQPAVDEINRILGRYGFNNFRIEASLAMPNHYQIQREDGSLAQSTLSEGEITFITFLYYLQLVKGSTDKTNISEERIVVVDDPISSLDSNVLFVVSSLLKEVIKNVRNGIGNVNQIIVFTHNVYFHKEVSYSDIRKQDQSDTEFWILRKVDKVTSIHSYGNRNPIHSSYELLWQEVKDWRRNSGITLQNTMRRIIENYFKILGGYKDDDLIEKFATHEEQEICRSLLCWVNDGSHFMSDDLFIEHPDDISAKYLEVFKRVFEETNHLEHYKMMMGEGAIELESIMS